MTQEINAIESEVLSHILKENDQLKQQLAAMKLAAHDLIAVAREDLKRVGYYKEGSWYDRLRITSDALDRIL